MDCSCFNTGYFTVFISSPIITTDVATYPSVRCILLQLLWTLSPQMWFSLIFSKYSPKLNTHNQKCSHVCKCTHLHVQIYRITNTSTLQLLTSAPDSMEVLQMNKICFICCWSNGQSGVADFISTLRKYNYIRQL